MKPSEDAQTRVGTGFGGEPRWHRCLRQEGWSRENTDPHLPSWGSSWGVRYQVGGPLCRGAEGFARRKKTSLWFVGSLLVVSVSILTIGLAATTRTENVTVGGYYPGITLGFGAFLGIIGINLVENRRQMLVAAIVFISFGVVAAFCCAIVDGVFAARHIDPRPLTMGRCQFFASEAGYVHDAYQTEVRGACQMLPVTPSGPAAHLWVECSTVHCPHDPI
uniref:Transmembrane protein 255B n=1 Tax=Ailuropoda melanoleuca TaxID=9646 RepID=G1LCZ3_AILME